MFCFVQMYICRKINQKICKFLGSIGILIFNIIKIVFINSKEFTDTNLFIE